MAEVLTQNQISERRDRVHCEVVGAVIREVRDPAKRDALLSALRELIHLTRQEELASTGDRRAAVWTRAELAENAGEGGAA